MTDLISRKSVKNTVYASSEDISNIHQDTSNSGSKPCYTCPDSLLKNLLFPFAKIFPSLNVSPRDNTIGPTKILFRLSMWILSCQTYVQSHNPSDTKGMKLGPGVTSFSVTHTRNTKIQISGRLQLQLFEQQNQSFRAGKRIAPFLYRL